MTLLPGGDVRNWNNGAVALFGYTAQEATGRSILGLIFLEQYRSRFEQALLGLRRGEEFSGESVGSRKDGTQIEIRSSSRRIWKRPERS